MHRARFDNFIPLEWPESARLVDSMSFPSTISSISGEKSTLIYRTTKEAPGYHSSVFWKVGNTDRLAGKIWGLTIGHTSTNQMTAGSPHGSDGKVTPRVSIFSGSVEFVFNRKHVEPGMAGY